jgi:hypothetical protein
MPSFDDNGLEMMKSRYRSLSAISETEGREWTEEALAGKWLSNSEI